MFFQWHMLRKKPRFQHRDICGKATILPSHNRVDLNRFSIEKIYHQ